MEAVPVAAKVGRGSSEPLGHPKFDIEADRRCEALLLACSTGGLIPLYGFYPPESDQRGRYYWVQPQSGFLLVPGKEVELTVAAPPGPSLSRLLRIEVRAEDETAPRVVFAVVPGKTVSLRVPLHGADLDRSSLLLRLTAGFDFVPRDCPGNPDTPLLAFQPR